MERVAPAVEQVTGQPMAGEPQFYEIANLIQAGQTVSRASAPLAPVPARPG